MQKQKRTSICQKVIQSIRLVAVLIAGLIGIFQLGCSPGTILRADKTPDNWDSKFVEFALSPGGKTIAFTGAGEGGSALYLLDLKTLRVHALTHSSEGAGAPQFSPDGKQIVYVASAGTTNPTPQIFVCALDGTHGRQLTFGRDVVNTMPSFSPNGKQIVFAQATLYRPYSFGGMVWDHYDIYAMDKDGSHQRRLTNKQYYQVVSPKMAPQSQTVVYQADHDTGSPTDPATDVFQVDAAHPGEPVMLTSNGRGYGPVYSASGSQIYYLSYSNLNDGDFDYEVWVMNSDGRDAHQITHAHSLLQNIEVAPDGEHLFVLSDNTRMGHFNLEEVTLADGRMRRIADSSLFDDSLHWTPSASE